MRACPSGNSCRTAAVHCFLLAARHGDGIRQYDLYRDMRTYGQNEQLLAGSRERRSGLPEVHEAASQPALIARFRLA
jgi:hypothetical protein